MSSDSGRSRAVVVLERVLSTGRYDRPAIANELVVSPARLERYLTGSLPMPLDRQLLLALFVIEKVPELSRMGYQLRGQVMAAVAFETHVTATHSAPPDGRF
jgi:hypothetical protein